MTAEPRQAGLPRGEHRITGHVTRAAFPLPDVTWKLTAPFWAGAAAHHLLMPTCDTCGRYRWYPKDVCRFCDGEPFTWTEVSGRGTLFSWVVVTHPFLPQFADLVPFVPALVALDEDPSVRVPTRMVDCDVDALTFDMPVSVTFRPISFTGVDGEVVAPLFVPST
jgi:uncharacterized OB-fold protein